MFESFAKDDEFTCPEIVGGTPVLGDYSYSCTGQYMYNGVLTTQRLVHDFIMVETGAKDKGYFVAEHGVKFAPFPSPEFVENGFYAAIAGKFQLVVHCCRND
jgi:hypothetical protein